MYYNIRDNFASEPFALAFSSDHAKGISQTCDETVDRSLHSLFRTSDASNALLTCYSVDGNAPARKTWSWDRAQETLPKGFKLKTVAHRDWKLAKNDRKLLAKGQDPYAAEAPPDPFMPDESRLSGATTAGFDTSASAPDLLGGESSTTLKEAKPLRKVDKYYKALMKAQREREEMKRREEYEEFLAKAEKAAKKSKKAAERREREMNKTARSFSTSSSKEEEDSEEEESDGEDPGPLKAYPGVMKVEVEVCVTRAPGGTDDDDLSFSEKESTATPSTARSKSESDDEVDWAAELAALQEEFQEPEKEESSESDSLPDGLDGRNVGNIDANDAKRVALGLGGSAFFVPDVERYALAPSLLPPPPRAEGRIAQIGKKRLRLKPRLPLEISKHRWRDEHPYGCPLEDEFTPDFDERREYESKVRLVDFYGSLNSVLQTMPKPDGIRKLPKADNFDQMLDYELRNSLAWKQYIKRQRLLEIARVEKRQKSQEAQVAANEKLLEGMSKEGSVASETAKSSPPESRPITQDGDRKDHKEHKGKPQLSEAQLLAEKIDRTIKKPPPVPGAFTYMGTKPPPIKHMAKARSRKALR